MVLTGWRRFATGLLCAALAAVGLTVVGSAGPVPTARAAPTLESGFVLHDTASGQNRYDLTDFAYLPDGSAFTTGKSGRLAWVSSSGVPRTITNLPVHLDGDLGLISVAVAPNYATSKHIYLVRSMRLGNGSLVVRVARWTVTGSPAPTGITDERVILEGPVDWPDHAITGIVPDPDGTLWISNGDNAHPGYADLRALRARDVNAIQGKLLHVTAEGRGVPTNPFYDPANPDSVASKVYAMGLRSPFRLTIDRETGFPIVGDVGWNAWEEVNIVRPGEDYSWPCWEGDTPTPGYSTMPECAGVPNNEPLWTYQHGSAPSQGNSVTGGIVYRGTSYPERYHGAYFFADYVGKKIWTLRYDEQGRLTQQPQDPPLGMDIGGPVKFEAAANGDIVYADLDSATLRRLSFNKGNTAPIAKATTSTEPSTRTVTFDGTQSLDFDGDPLTYQWDFGDGNTGTGATVTYSYPPGTGRTTARLTVTDPDGASGSTDIVVVPSNHSPELELTTQGDHTFAVHEQVSLSAVAADAEDGPLQVQWTTNVVHCQESATCHAHPGPGGTGPSFGVPFTDHPDSRMDVTATVTDSEGVTTSRTYQARPREHLVTLTSSVPATMQIPAEGGVSSSMVTEGATIDVVAAGVATDGTSTFAAWTDGTASASRRITVGPGDITLTARYTTPIDRRFDSDAALRQLLGAPTGPETLDVGGRHRQHERGRLYWSPQNGVHEVHGAILAAYLADGGPGRRGMPLTDETATADGTGRYNHFALNTSVYWSPNTGAHVICCQIRDKWNSLGAERSYLGYPTTSELVADDNVGHFNHFANRGSIYWTPGTGAQAICCQIRQEWQRLGAEKSYLGYPAGSETRTPDGIGAYTHFTNRGSIYWSPSAGAQAICCQIREKWASMGWERSYLGYPATGELVTPDGVGHYNHFTNRGSIYWTPSTGARATCCQIRQRWAALGWERSYLGYPTSDEFSIPGGKRTNYQHGYIWWRASDGAVFDRRY